MKAKRGTAGAVVRPCVRLMQRLESWTWDTERAIDLFGVRVRVRTKGVETPSIAEGSFPFGWRETRSTPKLGAYSWTFEGGVHRLFVGGRRLARSEDASVVLAAMHDSMNRVLTIGAPKLIFVHAGVVAYEGRALLLPGKSMAGKTTLVRALCERGATYLSDEYAPLDARGRVVPYPRPLGVRDASVPIDASSLGFAVATSPVSVAMVASVTYDAEASWSPSPMTPSESMMSLLENTVSVRYRPHETMPRVRAVTTKAIGLRATRGDVERAADVLWSAMKERSLPWESPVTARVRRTSSWKTPAKSSSSTTYERMRSTA